MNQHFVSQNGLDELKKELKHRETVLRREIAEKIGTAKDQGDLSENFEYQESKDQQAQNETRIIELRDLLSKAILVDAPKDNDKISLGNSFIAESSSGEQKTFQLVGSTEANPMEGKISNDSPLGNAFIGSGVNEEVEIETPSGKITYKIISIS